MDDRHQKNTRSASAQEGEEFADSAVNECAEVIGAEADDAEASYCNGEIVETTDGTLSDEERIELERASGMPRMASKRSAGYVPPLSRDHAYPHPEFMLEAALSLSEQHFPVFPCNPTGERAKQPITKRGFKDASTDPDKIYRWWTQWKSALIGIPMGLRSGVWVLDIDPKNGGITELQRLESKFGPLPETRIVKTTSGGYHYYFRFPDGIEIRNSAGKVAPGIDVRSEGGVNSG